MFLDASGSTYSDCILANYSLSLFFLPSHTMTSVTGFFPLYQKYCQVLLWLEQLHFHMMVLVFVPSALVPLFTGCNRFYILSLVPTPFCLLYTEFILTKEGWSQKFLLTYIILTAPELHHCQMPFMCSRDHKWKQSQGEKGISVHIPLLWMVQFGVGVCMTGVDPWIKDGSAVAPAPPL